MNENMILNLGGSGGGAPLNFRVVGNPQPTNPKENTIWLNTDVPIGSWYFDASQPDDLQEGDVWFSVGTSSPVEFNALKKNGIQVYPLGARQMIGSSLVSKNAKIYQGGEWVSWITYLYNSGDQCTEITGGWERKAYGGTAGSVTLNSDNITIVSSDSSVCAGAADFDANRISNYNTMKCIVSFTRSSTDGLARFGVSSTYSLGSSGIDSKWIAQQGVQSAQDAEMSLDISTVASGYPMLLAFHGTAVFKKVWFE